MTDVALSTTSAVSYSAGLGIFSKEQTVVRSSPESNCSSSSSSADRIIEQIDELASTPKESDKISVPTLENHEVNTAIYEEIVCELLEAKYVMKIKTESENDVTKDKTSKNEISDRLSRIE